MNKTELARELLALAQKLTKTGGEYGEDPGYAVEPGESFEEEHPEEWGEGAYPFMGFGHGSQRRHTVPTELNQAAQDYYGLARAAMNASGYRPREMSMKVHKMGDRVDYTLEIPWQRTEQEAHFLQILHANYPTLQNLYPKTHFGAAHSASGGDTAVDAYNKYQHELILPKKREIVPIRGGDHEVEANLKWEGFAKDLGIDPKKWLFWGTGDRYLGFGYHTWKGAWTYTDPKGPWTLFKNGEHPDKDELKSIVDRFIKQYGEDPDGPGGYGLGDPPPPWGEGWQPDEEEEDDWGEGYGEGE